MSFEFAKCLDKGRQLQAQGAFDEGLLQLLRQQGASMFESVKLMRQLKPISLREAQDLVHFSTTWTDHKESHEQLQDAFVEGLRQLGVKKMECGPEDEVG